MTWAVVATCVMAWCAIALVEVGSPEPVWLWLIAVLVAGLAAAYLLDRLLLGRWLWPLGPHRPRRVRPASYWRWLLVLLVPTALAGIVLWSWLDTGQALARSLQPSIPALAIFVAGSTAWLVSLWRSPDWDTDDTGPA